MKYIQPVSLPKPWTIRFGANFRPSLGFYEHRVELLRSIENAGLLSNFAIKDDRVSVRLGDALHRISFTASSFAGAVLQPGADLERVLSGIEQVWEALQIKQAFRPTFDYQWVIPLEGSYDASRAIAARNGWGIESLNDFALLGDGSVASPPTHYRVEAGIVSQVEIPTRLARVTSRAAARDAEIPPSLWRLETLPAVAFFMDSPLSQDSRLADISELKLSQIATEELSRGVLSALMEKFTLEPINE